MLLKDSSAGAFEVLGGIRYDLSTLSRALIAVQGGGEQTSCCDQGRPVRRVFSIHWSGAKPAQTPAVRASFTNTCWDAASSQGRLFRLWNGGGDVRTSGAPQNSLLPPGYSLLTVFLIVMAGYKCIQGRCFLFQTVAAHLCTDKRNASQYLSRWEAG